MFDNLTERLGQTLKNIRGQGRITEANIGDALREIRVSLLDADAALPVVTTFLEDIKQRAIGSEVMGSLNPGQVLVKIVNDELIKVLGTEQVPLNFNTQPPAVILMAGLQGSGKTTTAAKLAKLLKEQQDKKVMVVSCDVYRPAAIEQLKRLAHEIEVEYFPSSSDQDPTTIAMHALTAAKTKFCDVLIIDTAGRLHIDNAMMEEIKQIHSNINPIETLFVVDSMTGQDAANTAKAFNDELPLTGIVLTKTDGDSRGGAALSLRYITGKPIKYIGIGEKIDAFEAFHPDRIASRILGMGDILGLVEQVERKIDKQKSEKLAKKLSKGKDFDLEDFREQMLQMNNMGGISGLVAKLPGMANVSKAAINQASDKTIPKLVAIINSMTLKERRFPHLINGSRKRRIANGSGTQIQDINRLLKQFSQMQKMMKKFARPGAMKQMMRGLGGLKGLKGMMPDDLL